MRKRRKGRPAGCPGGQRVTPGGRIAPVKMASAKSCVNHDHRLEFTRVRVRLCRVMPEAFSRTQLAGVGKEINGDGIARVRSERRRDVRQDEDVAGLWRIALSWRISPSNSACMETCSGRGGFSRRCTGRLRKAIGGNEQAEGKKRATYPPPHPGRLQTVMEALHNVQSPRHRRRNSTPAKPESSECPTPSKTERPSRVACSDLLGAFI